MYLGKVIGTVVSTIKVPSLEGSDGETVLVAKGSSARKAAGANSKVPVDAAIIGIVDTVEVSQV